MDMQSVIKTMTDFVHSKPEEADFRSAGEAASWLKDAGYKALAKRASADIGTVMAMAQTNVLAKVGA